MDSGSFWVSFLIGLFVLWGWFLILRWFWCWYLRINERVKLQENMSRNLYAIATRGANEETLTHLLHAIHAANRQLAYIADMLYRDYQERHGEPEYEPPLSYAALEQPPEGPETPCEPS